jgi:hypothetical protein
MVKGFFFSWAFASKVRNKAINKAILARWFILKNIPLLK